MDAKLIAIAEGLYHAQQTLTTIAPISDTHPEITIDDAYAIQQYITKKRLESGQKIVGRKIGLTSKVMQELFHVNEPDYGTLFEDLIYPNRSVIKKDKMIQARVEAEVAFILKQDLPGPDITALQVLQATEGVMPCLEIIDSRIEDYRIKIQDTVADNASCWGVILGPKLSPPLGIDYSVLGLTAYKNGEVVATATGAAVLGNPLNSVAWLANKLLGYGVVLKAGDIVISGSLIGAFPIDRGDVVQANFDRIGEVSVIIG
jgi:2-oxopent-4-enoate hydratase